MGLESHPPSVGWGIPPRLGHAIVWSGHLGKPWTSAWGVWCGFRHDSLPFQHDSLPFHVRHALTIVVDHWLTIWANRAKAWVVGCWLQAQQL